MASSVIRLLAVCGPPLLAGPLLLGRLVLRGMLSLLLGTLPLQPASTIVCQALASA